MSYFNSFPIILDYEIQGEVYDGIDITRRTNIISEVKNNPNAYMEYSVRDGESPEILADRIYDDGGLYWVIMMFNDRFDIANEWPLDQVSLEMSVDRRYGNKKHAIRYYLSAATGTEVDLSWPDYDRVPITNYEYELKINDDKRNIKVPLEQYASQIAALHRKLIRK